MICYNCGGVLTNSDFCSHCGMNVSVYKRIVKLSNTYYNAGLTKAKNRDLSGAADTLRRSVKLNKRNIDARNLLGLVYFEMGETVQAFSEWVISTNIQPDNNPADRYLLAIQKDKSKVDELNHTIKKFNVALEYAKNGTDDMAIIQLKKVLNQNPNLIKAYQLLCLLYIKGGHYERAKRTIKKSLKIDRCNPLSIRYLREINSYIEDEKKNDPEKGVERRRGLRGMIIDRPYLSGDDVIIPENNFKEAVTGAQSIMYVVIGLLLGAALVYFVVTPARMSNLTEKMNQAQVEYDRNLKIKDAQISKMENDQKDLKDSTDKLKNELSGYTETGGTITDNYNYLLQAVEYFINDDTDKSIEALEKVNDSLDMNSETFTNVYDTLNKKMSSKIAKDAYEKGYKAYGQGNYDSAITYLKQCLKIEKTNDDAMYYIGWAYQNKGDNTNAKKYFRMIVEKCPGSEYMEFAKAQTGE